MSRPRTFVLLAILLFIIHFALTTWAVSAWTEAVKPSRPFEERYAPSFALAVTTLPLYPTVGKAKMDLLFLAALNSLLVALIAATLAVFLRWKTLLAIVVAVPLLLVVGMLATATILELRVAQGFQRVPRPAAVTENDSARHIEQIAARFRAADHVSSDAPRELNDYVWGEVERGDDRIMPVPRELDHYLIEHRWDLDELEHLLLEGEPPRFAGNNRQLAPFYSLQKTMLADALQSATNGDQDGAWQRVDAAQRLTQAMLAIHHGISSVVYATENQLGVARKLAPPALLPIRRFDPHEQWIDALATDAEETLKERGAWFVTPYVRLAAAESADSDLREAAVIRRLRGCRFDLPREWQVSERVPFNPFGVFGGGAEFAIHGNRMLLDFEGTEKVLALKRGQLNERSRCGDRHWRVEGNVLRLEPPLPPARPPSLQTHHEISPATHTPS
ncbi:MAG TPA: hypothetical protein VLV78_23510 [Thermoanaerobaculia bacterium]|nr:hypothetical protein [Thermoanaerobaculia bacterium]